MDWGRWLTPEGLDTVTTFTKYVHYQLDGIQEGYDERSIVRDSVYIYDTIRKTIYDIDTIGSSGEKIFIK